MVNKGIIRVITVTWHNGLVYGKQFPSVYTLSVYKPPLLFFCCCFFCFCFYFLLFCGFTWRSSLLTFPELIFFVLFLKMVWKSWKSLYMPPENIRKPLFSDIFSGYIKNTQPAFTYSKLIIETLEQGVEYVQS